MWFTTMLWWYSHKIPMSTLLLSSTLREIWRFHVHQYTLLDITCLRKSIVEIYLDYICLNSRIVFNMPHKGNQRCTMVYILKIVTQKKNKRNNLREIEFFIDTLATFNLEPIRNWGYWNYKVITQLIIS